MMTNVVVKHVPDRFAANDAWSFLEEVRPLLKSQRQNLVLDFSGVSFLDRSGILVLVKCFEASLKQNCEMKLAAVPSDLLRTLQQTGLDQICDIYETGKEAIDSFYEELLIPQLMTVLSSETHQAGGD